MLKLKLRNKTGKKCLIVNRPEYVYRGPGNSSVCSTGFFGGVCLFSGTGKLWSLINFIKKQNKNETSKKGITIN